MTRAERLVLVLLTLLLGACASAPAPRPAPPSAAALPKPALSAPHSSKDIAFRALGLVGTPYVRAGSDPRVGFDCSGFVVFVYRDVLGLSLPRNTAGQFELPRPRPERHQLRTGDLVFFNTSGRGVSHVGIYVGEGRFVHAPNHGGRVRLDALDDRYWASRYLGARRLLGS